MKLVLVALSISIFALGVVLGRLNGSTGPRTYADCVVHGLQGMPAPLTQMGAMINNDAIETACKQRFPK